MPGETPDSVALGRAEVTRRRWREGYDLLRGAAAEGPLDGAALDALVEAAFALGQSDEYSEAREQAYAAHLGDGALQLAAADAVRLAVVFVRRGELARAAGWLGTGGSLLDDEPGQCGTGTALVTWLRGAFAAATGDLVTAEQTIDLGRRMRDLEVQTLGLVVRGEVLAARAGGRRGTGARPSHGDGVGIGAVAVGQLLRAVPDHDFLPGQRRPRTCPTVGGRRAGGAPARWAGSAVG